MSPISIRINARIVDDLGTPEAQRVREAVERHREQDPTERRYVRLQGVSLSGPCPLCIPYFGVQHDGSGSTVPAIPLHDDCVCRDVPVDMYVASNDGREPPSLKPGQWMTQSTEGRAVAEKAFGTARTQLMDAGLMGTEDLYLADKVQGLVPLPDLAARLAGRRGMKAKVVALARAKSIDISSARTTREMLDIVIKRIRRA